MTVAVSWSQRHCYAVIVVAALLSGLLGWYTVNYVGINTNTEDMLSDELQWRVAYTDFKHAFPYFSDTVVVVIDAATPDLAFDSAARLRARLEADTANFSDVFYPQDDDFFRYNQLLYATTEDLEGLADKLSSAQALLGRMSANPGLAGMLELLTDVAVSAHGPVPAQARELLVAVQQALDEVAVDNHLAMSWQTLMTGQESEQSRVIFTVTPRLDFATLLPASTAIESLRQIIDESGYANHPYVQVRLTGGAALGYDELRSVIRGAESAGLLAFVMIVACLAIGLRSFALIVATLFTLLVGLVITASFATAVVGTLNMISVAFAVLYVGLGVDFAIHLALRYRELCAKNDKSAAIQGATGHLGGSLMLCAVTTSIGFFAFMPTAYRGVAELGLISGVGMFVGLATSFTLLPALLQALPAPRIAPASDDSRAFRPTSARQTRFVLRGALLSAVVAACALPFASFDLNPLHLNDPQAESVTTIDALAENGDQPLYDISVLVGSTAQLEQQRRELLALGSVAGVRSIFDLIPANQDEKLAIVDDLRWSLGADDLQLAEAAPLDTGLIATAIATLIEALNAPAGETQASAHQSALAHSLRQLEQRLEALSKTDALAYLHKLEEKLMHHFPAQLRRLLDGLEAEAVDVSSLPDGLRARWIAADGRYRLEIKPTENLDDNANLARFVDTVRAITGDAATGTPIINIEASRAVSAAFTQAFVSAAILIAGLLWLVLRRIRDVLVIIAPLALAGLLTTAASIALSMPFNFANIIALPLLLGIGVDSALHMFHRYTNPVGSATPLLATSTARAILFSALTTTASFGNLAFSPHAGTASMGVMLSIGLVATLLCTLIVMPALLAQFTTTTGASS